MTQRRKFVGVIRLPEALRAVKAEQNRRGRRTSEHTLREQTSAAARRGDSGGRFTPPAPKRAGRRGQR